MNRIITDGPGVVLRHPNIFNVDAFHRHLDISNFQFKHQALRNSNYRSTRLENKIGPSTIVKSSSSPVAQSRSSVSTPHLEGTTPSKRLAVFVSGGGSNFRAIHAAIIEGQFSAEVAAVVTNAPSCGGAKYAQEHGIPVIIYPPSNRKPSTVSEFENNKGLTAEQLTETLQNTYNIDYIILAGYMKLIPSTLVRAYHRAMLNIHPGLLPSFGGHGFYGQRVHEAVIRSGTRFSGPTVHFVDEEYDTGPILAQAVVPVYPTDDASKLAARVLKEEHKVYPRCVAALCEGRITWRDDGIPIMWSAH